MRAGTPAHPGTLRIARMRARRPRSWHAQDCAYAGGTPAHPGCMWFSVPGSWFSVRDARAPRMHVVLGSRFLVLGSGRPRSQGARGSRFSVLGSRFGTPAHPGCTWFSVLGSWFSVRDARAPRDALRRSPAGASRCSARASARSLRMRAGRPAHPGCTWFSVLGSWFSVRDARAPRMHVVLSSWFLVLGSGRPRSQGARGSRFLVLGSRFGTTAYPARGSRFLVLGSWFSVLGSWFLVLGSGRPRSQGRSPS
jgi:hypothetical protein